MRIYLDNCCYNRPYDNQSQIRIRLEAEAKLHIQQMIKEKKLELVTSYMLEYENSKNRSSMKRQAILDFIRQNESYYVGIERKTDIEHAAASIMRTGVKEKDAVHVASAVLAHCDFFVSTDDRLLRYQDAAIRLVSPCELIRLLEEEL